MSLKKPCQALTLRFDASCTACFGCMRLPDATWPPAGWWTASSSILSGALLARARRWLRLKAILMSSQSCFPGFLSLDLASTRRSSLLTDHPLSSGRDQLGVCGRRRVQDAAVEDATEEVVACVTAVEPVAELVEVGLQVRGADAMEDVELPALEVGDDDVHPGQQLAGGLRRGLCVRLVQVTGAGQGLGAGVVDHAQVRAAEAAPRRLLGRDRDQRLASRGASALAAASITAADQRLVKLDHAT